MDKLTELGRDIAGLWADNALTYLNGAKNTIVLAVVATAIGCLIGLLCGILQTIPSSKTDNPVKRFFLALIRAILRIYVEVFRGTPMILQAVFVFFALPYFSNNLLRLGVLTASYIVVSINTGAYMAETVRGGILSIDIGQTEGAKAIGMNHVQTMTHVILPQTLRNILPQIGNNLIINIKDTCVLSVIGTVELFFATKSVAGTYYTYFEANTIAMVMYLCMTLFFSWLLRLFEKKLEGGDSFDLSTTDTLAHTSGMIHYRERAEGKRS